MSRAVFLGLSLLLLLATAGCSTEDAPPAGSDATLDRQRDALVVDQRVDTTYSWPDGPTTGRAQIADGAAPQRACNTSYELLTRFSGKATHVLAFPDLIVIADPYLQPEQGSARGTLKTAAPPFAVTTTDPADLYSGPWGFGTVVARVAVGIVAGNPSDAELQLDDPRSGWSGATRYRRTQQDDDRFGQSVVVADVAGDARPEMIIAAPGDPINGCAFNSGIYLFNQLPTGGVLDETQATAIIEPTFRCGGTMMAAADINNDGKQDLVVGSWANGARVFYGPLPAGRLDGLVDSQVLFYDRLGQLSLQLGDIDGDGWVDLVVSERERALIVIGPLAPTHQLLVEAIEVEGRVVAPLADLDGDGALDILLVQGAQHEQLVLAQRPFSPAPKLTTLLTSTEGPIAEGDVADVTGDGCPDLALIVGDVPQIYASK